MGTKLSFISDALDVEIENYSDCKFEYDKWIVSDKYVLNEKQPRLSKYSIVVTSPNIETEEELNDYRINGERVVNRITHFIPFCGLPTLNSPKSMSVYRDVSFIDYQKAPKGWEMNYNEIKETFRDSQAKHSITVSVEGFKPYSIIDSSPLGELNTIMNNYDLTGEEIKFLIFLNNAILTSTDSNAYMLIGKALEIINAIYPLKGKKDNRINEYFPELEEMYKGHTIKELIGLCNNRKETRHYIKKDKTQLISHESLSKEEGLLLFKFSTNLILNVVRDKFDLPHMAIKHE